MKTWFNAWRAAVRIARRDAWRFKGRSFLVLAMIALPIVGVSAMDLTLRSAELSTEEKLNRTMGAADARLTDPSYGGEAIFQAPDGLEYRPKGNFDDKPWPDGPTDLAGAVPTGAGVLKDTTANAKLRTTHGLLNTEVRELKAADPMTRGMMTLKSGRFPEKGGEVAATTHFLKSSGLSVGSKLTARGLDADYRIVGSYELPSDLDTDQVNALPGALLAPLAKALKADGLVVPRPDTTLLVSTSGGFTWNMVQGANAKGVVVTSRAVALNPPADADVPLYQMDDWQSWETSPGASTTELAVLATVVGLAMLEICLLAGPAFAVGARRSRRQLGLVGANGGARHHIRAIVLAGGLVIGVVSAVVGTALGIGLTAALRPVLEEYLGKRFGGFEIRPLEILGIALLAVITGLLSALVPAITSSRQSVLSSLTGRRGVRKSSRVLPLLGLVALLGGATIALYGSLVSKKFVIVAGGSAIAELGIVAMTPALVGLFGRVGRWLPLSPRLALRDAVRNRGRTAPAVAAVLAAVAGTVAVSTYAASSEAQDRAAYAPQLPGGAASFTITEDNGRDVPTVRTAVEKILSTDVRAPVDRIVVGKPNCPDDECGYYEVIVPKANRCPLWDTGDKDASEVFSKTERQKLAKDWRCAGDSGVYTYIPSGVLVGDANVLKVLGIEDPGAEKALADGRIVSLDKQNVDADGKVGIRLVTDMEKADLAAQKGEDWPGEIKSFTAHQVPGDPNAYGVSLVLTPAMAKSAGLRTVPAGAYYSLDQAPSDDQKQRLDSEIASTGSEVDLRIEEGYTSRYNLELLVLTVFAGLITIGAAGIATGLAQADAEADLKTLASVGAPARVRRTLSGFQCGVVAVMGVVLGSVAGVLPAIGLRLTQKREEMAWYHEALDKALSGTPDVPYVPIVIPWETMAMLLIAVPVGAALLAALVTRSHRTLGRRAAT
ncbi:MULTISPECIES: ABC transporter permease [unclassified Streptomyces]|uniref:ABC transporter permease n=1 Tax=unclassified Streptomyces TaxID=2593676 RepID=UPI002E2C43E2|nr:ABC transporter permease [Streptomyces sp. NBC_01429]